MNEFFATNSLLDLAIKCCVAMVVIVVDTAFSIPKHYHPLSLVGLLAKRIANKVRPNQSAPTNQALISGALSYIVLFVPFLVVLHILISFAHIHVFFDFVLLLIACSFSSHKATFIKIQLALSEKKKLLARQWLSTIVTRDTASLSNLGICKAAIESLFLRYVYQLITPLFIFLVTGPILALGYRIALECYWQWKRPFTKQSMFARPVQLLCKLCQILPMFIVAALFFLFILKRNTNNQKRELVVTVKPKIILWQLQPLLFSVVGTRLGFSLAGPLQYQNFRTRLPRYGAGLQVRLSDMKAATQTVTALSSIIFSALLASCLLITIS